MPMQCYVHVKSQSRGKNRFFTLKNFRLLHYPGILQRLRHLIIQFPLYYLLVAAYDRWSHTRGSQYSDLAEKFLVFWKSGR